MEVDANGKTIVEVAEEEENDIDIDDEEVINLGTDKSNLKESDQDGLQESVVMDIVDEKRITQQYGGEISKLHDHPDEMPILETLNSDRDTEQSLHESQIQLGES